MSKGFWQNKDTMQTAPDGVPLEAGPENVYFF